MNGCAAPGLALITRNAATRKLTISWLDSGTD